MRKRNSAAAKPLVRQARTGKSAAFISSRLIFLILIISLTMVSVAGGYYIGRSQEQVSASGDIYVTAGLDEMIKEKDSLCQAVEKVNVQQKLAAEQERNLELAESLEEQQREIEIQQEEMENLESRILDSLMANFSDQLISRSSSTISAYSQEAKNLLDLYRKLNAFEKTEDSQQIDLSDYRAAIERRLLRIPTLKPISGRLTGYGYRIHPIYGYRHFHAAVDMGAPTGTPIKASATGYVTESGYNRSAGNYVKIDHGNGFTTAYLHCHKLLVKRGDTVVKGEVIATVGNTGTSTHPHLHFEIHLHGKPIDPNHIIME